MPDAATTAHRALVVDDDPDAADLVVTVLEGLGLSVVTAADATGALRLAREHRPDLITLDLVLPDGDGTEVCRELRAFTDAYVVMITGRDAEVDRLVGLEVGADEYLVKPFSPRELRARATALLRRPRLGASPDQANSSAAPPTPAPARPVDLGGGLVVDLADGRTTHDGAEVALTPPEAQVLVVLAEEPGRAWSRADLARTVWAGEFIESDFLVDVQVAGLRRKLRAATGADPVSVVEGSAYRLDPS